MAQALNLFDNFRLKLFDGAGIDLDADTIKAMLTTSVYSPAQATHDFKDDVTNEVAAGGNYAAGGAALGSKTVGLAAGVVKFDAADVTWLQHASNPTNARRMVLYKDTGVAGTSPLIAYGDLAASDVDMTAGDTTLQWNAAGIVTSP